MSDPLHPTSLVTELYDPEIYPPPKSKMLLLINEGGKLIEGMWYEGAQAWGYKPRIPETVKARQRARMAALLTKKPETA